MRNAWDEFLKLLDRIEIRNKKVYDDLYKETIKNLEDFQKDAGDNKSLFQNNAPFNGK